MKWNLTEGLVLQKDEKAGLWIFLIVILDKTLHYCFLEIIQSANRNRFM